MGLFLCAIVLDIRFIICMKERKEFSNKLFEKVRIWENYPNLRSKGGRTNEQGFFRRFLL